MPLAAGRWFERAYLKPMRFADYPALASAGIVSGIYLVTDHLEERSRPPSALCVPKTSSTSSDQAIFANRVTGASPSSDAAGGWPAGRSCRVWTWRPSGGGGCRGASAGSCPG